MSVLANFHVGQARRRLAESREALRRYQAGEPVFDEQPQSNSRSHYLGVMLANVAILAESLETLIAELDPTP